MAFDVYVGTMTRFYRRDWENIVQQMARRDGMKYHMIYAGGEPAAPPSAEEVRTAVSNWSKALSGGLAPHGYGPVAWDEADDRPYFTDRPGWGGYCALLLWAAHAEHPELPLPDALPESWVDDSAYQLSVAKDSGTRFRTILEPQLWLPCDFPFVFTGPTLVSEKGECMGSVFALKKQLDDLYESTAAKFDGGRAEDIAETPPSGKSGMFSRLFGRSNRTPPTQPTPQDFAQAAQSGLSVLRNLAAQACEHRLPILLHF